MSFGVYDFAPDTEELRKEGMRIRLEGQPVAVLKMLLERPGELVTREELQNKLWATDRFVDFDNSLNAAIKRLRAALNDSAVQPRYIETLARRGYRFIGSVNPAGVETDITTPADVPASTAVHTERALGSRNRWMIVVAVCVLAVCVWGWRQWRHPKGVPPLPVIRSLAVLPLQNLSGDPSQDFLADGMTEELIGRLSRIHGLRVVSRTSSMHFKNTQLSVPEIAKMLAVDAIVEGSLVQERHQIIRVHAQLIRAATDEHIWAGEYQREYQGILEVQEEVARNIVEQIELNLTPEERARLASRPPVDPQAYENYLKGRYYFSQRTKDALQKSIASFQQAITSDPAYAPAYSGLAEAYAMLGFRGGLPSNDALSGAKKAALKAIELDNSLAEPHASLAFIWETYDWDWPGAERQYKKALELNPGYAQAHNWYAGYLTYTGRFNEGITEAMRARELDPLSLPLNNALAGRLLAGGRYDEALRQVQQTLELDDHFAPAHQTLGWVYLHSGKQSEAIREFQDALELSGAADTDIQLDLGFAYAVSESGRRQEEYW